MTPLKTFQARLYGIEDVLHKIRAQYLSGSTEEIYLAIETALIDDAELFWSLARALHAGVGIRRHCTRNLQAKINSNNSSVGKSSQ